MNNLLCVKILKILLFLGFFPGSLFLKNFPLLWRSVLNQSEEWTLSFVQQPHLEVPSTSIIKVINNQTKMILYLLDTIRKVRKNSKENLPIDIGTSRIKVTVVKMLSYSYPYCAL